MIEELYAAQAQARPLSRVGDYALLAVQTDLGGRKTTPERCLAALVSEMAALPRGGDGEALYERLEGGLCRLNLRPARARGLTADAVAGLHMDYLTRFRPDTGKFKTDIFALKRMCERDELPLDGVRAAFELEEMRAAAPLKWRHSADYLLAYHPAYRVVFIAGLKRLMREMT